MKDYRIRFSGIARLLERLDAFYAAEWWWRWQQQRAERRLDNALKSRGERAFETARATDRVEQMDFAVLYWRTAPGAIRRVVRQARKNGVPLHALRLAVLNADLSLREDRSVVRGTAFLRWLSRGMACLFWFHWSLILGMIVTAPGSVWWKAIVAIIATTVYAVVYRSWSLFLGRPCHSLRKWGPQLRQVCDHHRTSSVIDGRFAEKKPAMTR